MMSVRSLRKGWIAVAIAAASNLIVPGLHAQADDIRQTFPQVETTTPTGVNLQTGQFTERGEDMQFGPFSVDHFAQYAYYGAGGGDANKPAQVGTSLVGSVRDSSYWRDPKKLVQIGETQLMFEVEYQNGATVYFGKDPGARGWKMVASGTNFIVTNKSGVVYHFDSHAAIPTGSGVLVSRLDPDGHRLEYSYDGNAKLKNIISNRGYALVFSYGPDSTTVCGYNLALATVNSSTGCGPSHNKVIYGLSDGLLTSITSPDNHVTLLTYTAGKLTCVTLPDSSTCRISNTYAADGGMAKRDQVLQQVTATGETWNFTHTPVENYPTDYTPSEGEMRESFSWIDAPSAFATSAKFKNGFISEITTPHNGTQVYEYSTDNLLHIYFRDHIEYYYYQLYPKKITYPEGNSIEFARDLAGNVISRTDHPKPLSQEASRTVTWQYPTTKAWAIPAICDAPDVLCDKVIRITDYDGNVTDFAYSSTHGGVLSKTLPADDAGVRPQTRYTYAKKYAWTLSGGVFVQQAEGIWVLTKEEYCRTSAAVNVVVNANSVTGDCAAGAADEVVTTYEYEAGSASKGSNLQLLGTAVTADGTTLRSCVSYDALGRKISETKPAANLATCQ